MRQALKNIITMNKDTTNNNSMLEGYITIDELGEDISGSPEGKPPKVKKPPPEKKDSFPIDVLPLKAQEYAKGAKTALGIPEDFFAPSMLFTAASAAGNTCKLVVKQGVEQKAVSYMVLVGLPNSNKSGALKAAIKPLQLQDAENHSAYKIAKTAWETDQGKPKKEREGKTKPFFKRVVIADATPEAVATALSESPRGITLYRDELAGFMKNFNRYNQGGEEQFWLENWSGINLSIDRKTSEPIRVKNPFLGIIGTIQPGVIEELAKGTRVVNGFIDRFLFCWPEGLEKPKWSDDEINLPLVEAYETAIERLLGLTFKEDNKAKKLTLTAEARKQLFQFFNDDNKKLCDGAENEFLAGIYGKFDFHTSRLVIALHLLHWAYSREEQLPSTIEAKIVTQAIEVAKYFRTQALKVYNAIHQASPVEKLPADKRKLYEALPEKFKKADGLKIAKGLDFHSKTFSRFLQDRTLFEKIRHGEYGKIY